MGTILVYIKEEENNIQFRMDKIINKKKIYKQKKWQMQTPSHMSGTIQTSSHSKDQACCLVQLAEYTDFPS